MTQAWLYVFFAIKKNIWFIILEICLGVNVDKGRKFSTIRE